MNAYDKILNAQVQNNSRLCIGLDPDPSKISKQFKKNCDGIFQFLKLIIEVTSKFVCSYKINFAFFEQFGSKGIQIIENILTQIPNIIPTIADVKRSDIANSAKFYAKSIYEHFRFDGITLNPLLGKDSLEPFFDYSEKINFILILTSNPGAEDFQKISVINKFFYEILVEKNINWFPSKSLGFVVGGTNPEDFDKIRQKTPENFILSPGIGAQGGKLDKILDLNGNKPLIVNISRSILYPLTEKFDIKNVEERTKYYQNLLRYSTRNE